MKQDKLFSLLLKCITVLSFSILALMILSFAIKSSLVISKSGIEVLTRTEWIPSKNIFGVLGPAYGTLVTTFIALILAAPFCMGIAFSVVEVFPKRLSALITLAIDIMAGIPSIIFGMWALFFLSPLILHYVEVPLFSYLQGYELENYFFDGEPTGLGLFTTAIILAIMILPYITLVLVEAFRSVPSLLRESAYGLALYKYEYIFHILLPYTKKAILGAFILGCARALGETMAVTFVIGYSNIFSPSIFGPGTSLTSTLANEFGEALDGEHISALIFLGLILFLISICVISLGKVLVKMKTKT
jgi:phosphate transport system permease protein